MSNKKITSSDNIFGASLRLVRKALKLTQVEFAEPLSITGSYVSNIEKGQATPSEAVVREIIGHYLINRNYLKTGDGEMFTADYAVTAKEFATPTVMGGEVPFFPNPTHMTLEQKLNWMGFKTKDIRQIQEWSKLSEEEQDEELKRLCMQNIEKGRF